jgi:hypothetical protein
MPHPDIARMRLRNQRIAAARFERPEDVVAWLGAVQDQDYLGGVWGIALRTHDCDRGAVERAIAEKQIVRTWPMRYTLHFVPADDVRWMLALTAPRAIAKAAGRHRQLELDAATFKKARTLAERALAGGAPMPRPEFFAVLARAGIDPAGQRGAHIIGQLAHDGVICFGPREGAQQTLVLLDEWLPHARTLPRDEALAKIALRYFQSHGPATDRDLAWWTGLTLTECRSSIASVAHQLDALQLDDKEYWITRDGAPVSAEPARDVFLLPPWDEYLVGYTDRSHVLRHDHGAAWDPGNRGLATRPVIIDGTIAGTWRRTIENGRVTIAFDLFRALKRRERDAIHAEAERFGRFLGLPVRMRGAQS